MQSRASLNSKKPVYIVDGVRTPFLKVRDEPGLFSAADLAVTALRQLLQLMPFAAQVVDEVIVGCVAPNFDEANIARIIALRAGCGVQMPAWTVQRNCASGLQSIDSAVQNIRQGKSELVIAGGTEAMSRSPLVFDPAMVRWLARVRRPGDLLSKAKAILQFRPLYLRPVVALLKGLTDPIVNLNMGQTAEELAYRFNITRQEMDEFAMQSHHRASAAMVSDLAAEITPLYATDGSVYEQDNGIRSDSSLEKLAKLKPVFEKFGTITAGNSSQITDGATMLVLASEEAVKQYDLPVLARIVDIEWAGVEPSVMGMGPVHAMTPLLIKNHLTLNDVDHFEINEAFAAQVLACVKAWNDRDYCQQKLGLDGTMGELASEKLNPQGGAIALGHPVGASGARLTLHCAKMLAKHNLKRAMASLCIGGGQGGAILLEKA